MALDDAGRVWYVETGVQPNRMVAFDTSTKAFVYNEPIPGDGRNGVRHMVFDAERRMVWYGSDTNFIGAVAVPPPM
jgi:virginiamycin B lyase